MFIMATFFFLGTRYTGYLLSSSHKPARSLSSLEVPHTVSLTELTCFEIHLFTIESNDGCLCVCQHRHRCATDKHDWSF